MKINKNCSLSLRSKDITKLLPKVSTRVVLGMFISQSFFSCWNRKHDLRRKGTITATSFGRLWELELGVIRWFLRRDPIVKCGREKPALDYKVGRYWSNCVPTPFYDRYFFKKGFRNLLTHILLFTSTFQAQNPVSNWMAWQWDQLYDLISTTQR